MHNNQILRMLIVAGIAFIILILGAIFLSEQQQTFQKAEFSNYLEISSVLVLRFIGLVLIIFSIISMVMTGSSFSEAKNLTKWIVLILLGLLIINITWSLAFGIAIILAVLIITDYLGDHKKSSDAGSD